MRMEAVRQAWNDLPLVGIDTILQGRVPLILAPHPDDESLGCGGLIAQCCAAGTPPHVVILTDGCNSHPNSQTHPPERLRHLREEEAREALLLLGMPHWPDLVHGPDGHGSALCRTGLPAVGPAYRGDLRAAGLQHHLLDLAA